MTCRITDIEAGIRFRTNGRKVTAPQVNNSKWRIESACKERTPRRNYIRIEASRAGRLAYAKARVIRSVAAQLRYALRYALPTN